MGGRLREGKKFYRVKIIPKIDNKAEYEFVYVSALIYGNTA